MLQKVLRFGRFTRHLPNVRGLTALRAFYEFMLPKGELRLSVDNFDGDLKMDVDVRDVIGINIWHRPECFEKNERRLFCAAITPGSLVLDVGANVGIYTLLAAKRGARVIAVEADPRNVEMLRRHIHLNGFDDRVSVLHMAASDRDSALTLYRNSGNCGHSSLFKGHDPVVVPGKTIDSLGLPPIDVCKMDIEGAEMMALSGMRNSISRSPNLRLLIEYNPSLGQTNGMLEFLCERFRTAYEVRQPPLRAKGPLAATQRLPGFCNLWAWKVASDACFD